MSFELVLGDLGDGAGRAGLLAGAAGDAGVSVDDLGVLVAELQDAGGAGVNANAAVDALVGTDDGVRHDALHSLLAIARARSLQGRPERSSL